MNKISDLELFRRERQKRKQRLKSLSFIQLDMMKKRTQESLQEFIINNFQIEKEIRKEIEVISKEMSKFKK